MSMHSLHIFRSFYFFRWVEWLPRPIAAPKIPQGWVPGICKSPYFRAFKGIFDYLLMSKYTVQNAQKSRSWPKSTQKAYILQNVTVRRYNHNGSEQLAKTPENSNACLVITDFTNIALNFTNIAILQNRGRDHTKKWQMYKLHKIGCICLC